MTHARRRSELQFRRLWQVIGAILIAFVVYESLTPHPITVPVEQGDRVGHVLAYATLMFWFAQLDDKVGAGIAWVAAFVALGILMEFLQALTDYRSFELGDMVADGCGVAVGWIAAPPRSPHLLEFIESRWQARA